MHNQQQLWSTTSPPLPSRETLQQRLRLLEVSALKSLGKPAIDLCQQLPGGGALALLLPGSTQAQRRPEFQQLCPLTPRVGEGAREAGFCFPLEGRPARRLSTG